MSTRATDYKEKALRLHEKYRGKMEVVPKVPIKSLDDFSIWYTPGVAAPCRAIYSDKEKVYTYTWRWNLVAVVSDGSRVLGLGNIGPEAGYPVMEGKCLLFKYLGGVDAVPILLNTQDKDEIISIVKKISPSFGGINLEDIAKPKCFYILETLQQELDIPVWHDDQQGTALVTLAALKGALKVVNKRLSEVKIALIGAGAAGVAIAKYLMVAGAKPENMLVVDSKGILHANRKDIPKENRWKKDLAFKTNPVCISGGIKDALRGADVCIAVSKPGPGVIKKDWIKNMADDAIVFACANPVPEIWPWEAKEAGARIVATGRSDFPNQVNNSLGFPAIFRGVFEVQARKITDTMCLAAADALAEYTEKTSLSEDRIIPTMEETEAYVCEAVAVGLKAIEEGVARVKLSKKELEERCRENIYRARKLASALFKTLA
ncbi:MAG: malate dehydrogenase [Thermoprotei archaeon]|nr:MAG: malate dehydrogenase [Thermoprotei archaeon]